MLIFSFRLNGCFSTACAILMLLFTVQLDRLIPIGETNWLVLSSGLLVFAGALFIMSFYPDIAIKQARSVIAGDVFWVVISFSLAVYFYGFISTQGWLLISLINVFVSGFAVMQLVGLRRVTQE